MNTQSQTLFERHPKRRRKTPPNGAWAERVLANQSDIVLPFVGDKASSVVEVQARVNKWESRGRNIVRVLINCEFSGTVRRAFRARGHDAWSCDLLEAEDGSPYHIQGDAIEAVGRGWDLMVAHPPCTHLAVSGARWFVSKRTEQAEALEFVRRLFDANVGRSAVENPVSIISSKIRKPDQIIQPWQFGHGETKATCLWLKNLPKLVPTNIVSGREARVHKMPPTPDRWKERSRTFSGIAAAMAEQWG